MKQSTPFFKINKRIKKAFTIAFVVTFCSLQSVWADDAATIANYINTITRGDLTAILSGNTVTVTGSFDGVLSNTDGFRFSVDAVKVT